MILFSMCLEKKNAWYLDATRKIKAVYNRCKRRHKGGATREKFPDMCEKRVVVCFRPTTNRHTHVENTHRPTDCHLAFARASWHELCLESKKHNMETDTYLCACTGKRDLGSHDVD